MSKQDWQADGHDVEAIIAGRLADAFGVLGLQEVAGQHVLRAFIPHAEQVEAFTLDDKPLGPMIPRTPRFLRGQGRDRASAALRYRARNAGGEWNVLIL